MKKTLLYIFSLLTLSLWAQDGINYQGAATDANGDELANQNISIRASVLSTSANGNLEWEETHSTTTDQFGLFNVVIGQGTNTTNGATATFDDMDWGSANHFLKIEMDATGGTNYAMIGTTQMMAVPYALYAKSAGIDSTMLANMIASSGGGSSCNIEFPAGLDGVAITHQLSSSNYTVPSGKMLYILDFRLTGGNDLHIDALKFNNIIANKTRICNSGQVVSGGGNSNGLLVDVISDVIGITQNLMSSNYTVPLGKMLYILDFKYISNTDLHIDGLKVNNEARIKIAAGGQVISGGGNLNGYLVDENYFAGCGGSSSSGSNQSLSVSLNGDSLFISDGNFVLVPGISSTNYTKADFFANYTTVTITNPVSFTDLSTASPIAWHWDFGDGNTSTQQNPTHIYNNVGTHTVTLISTDANVSDTAVKTNYINATLEIGGYYQGGIIFYLDGNGGGLICTLQDLPNNQWGCYNTALPGAGGFNIGDGLQNTIDIVNACSQGMAARDCYNLSLNGYSDWFLPSKLELEYMQTQMSIIDSSAVSHGGGLFLQNGNGYWSSTQESSSGAWEYDMQTMGWTNHVNKDRSKSVRPIRAF